MTKLQPGFMLMLFVLSCKTWNVVKPGTWLARPPSGAQQSQACSPILPKLLLSLTLTAGSHSVTPSQGSVQAG